VPLGAIWPPVQVLQTVMPASSWYVVLRQAWHDTALDAADTLPGEQGAHPLCDALRYCPAWQAVQFTADPRLKLPVGQG